MRILFLDTSAEWFGRAGAFLAAGRALAARGYDVTFACPPAPTLAARVRGAQLVTVPADGGDLDWQLVRALRRVLHEQFIDVMFVHGERHDLAASLAARLAGRGVVVRRFAAGERVRTGWRTQAARRARPATYLVTAIPASDVDPPRDTTVISGDLGIDLPTPFRDDGVAVVPRGSPHLACIGSVTAIDGVRSVLRTVALLAERHPRIRLTLGGSAAGLDALRLHAAALNIAKHVEFLPGVAETDALRGAEMAWVVAHEDEAAFGCLHVMARGMPVLAPHTDVTEHYVTHGIHGALFHSMEPPAMAATVATYSALPAERERVGRAGRGRVADEFTERELANGFEQATRAARELTRVSA